MLLDLFLPIGVLRSLLGYISYMDVALIMLLYSVTWFLVTSLFFFQEQITIIRKGMTSFELDNNMNVINTNAMEQKIRGVLGKNWWLNFLLPVHLLLPETDSGISWENVEI
jgi:hypothetical protein